MSMPFTLTGLAQDVCIVENCFKKFLSIKITCMKHHFKPTFRKVHLEQVILHIDKNNFISRSPLNEYRAIC